MPRFDCARSVAPLTLIRSPSRKAPPPARAENISSVTGLNRKPRTALPSAIRPTETHQYGMPRRKLAVPSIGSMTQSGGPFWRRPPSSPRTKSSGKAVREPRDDQVLGLLVGLRDEILAALVLDRQRGAAAVIVERKRAGFAHDVQPGAVARRQVCCRPRVTSGLGFGGCGDRSPRAARSQTSGRDACAPFLRHRLARSTHFRIQLVDKNRRLAMSDTPWRGVYSAITTKLDDDENVDLDGCRRRCRLPDRGRRRRRHLLRLARRGLDASPPTRRSPSRAPPRMRRAAGCR